MSKRKSDEDQKTKKKKKTKTQDDDDEDEEEERVVKTYEERSKALSPIASPLADEKLTKRIHKLVKKASSGKALRRGVKEVVKAVRKGSKGLCVIAGDVAPVDVICHLPVFCEEKRVPYIYVPSKQDLGYAALTKRPTSCVLISPKPGETFEHQDLLDKTTAKVAKAVTN